MYGEESSQERKRSALTSLTVPGGLWRYARVMMSEATVDSHVCARRGAENGPGTNSLDAGSEAGGG